MENEVDISEFNEFHATEETKKIKHYEPEFEMLSLHFLILSREADEFRGAIGIHPNGGWGGRTNEMMITSTNFAANRLKKN